ncbi:MAG TPA: DUF1499 domain-containing protein [Usitatibacteraceae bacterium]
MKIIARIPLFVALIAVISLTLSGMGVRQGWWTYRFGFQILEWSAYGGLTAAVLAIAAVLTPALRFKALISLAVAMIIGVFTCYMPWQMKQQAQALPKIHDISTDLDNPPLFSKILPLRAAAPNPASYGGPEVAAAQKSGYPDIHPRDVALTPAETFARALAVSKAMDWEIVDADGGKGVIEATATTRWFGFKDDVVIRITPMATGSRVDMRSVSRVGRSDVGANAARIRAFFAALPN